MKRMIALALGAMMALSLVACGSDNTTHTQNPVEIPNPFTECKTMEEAAQLVGFDVVVPDAIEGMDKSVIRADAEGKLIEVIYRNEEEEIVIRKAVGSEDISGDYTQYADTNITTIGDLTVTTKGENGQINLATWTDNGYTYSIGTRAESGISSTVMTDLIVSIQ